LITLSVKKFFLVSNLNLPWCSLRMLPLISSLATWEKRLTPTLLQPPVRTASPWSGRGIKKNPPGEKQLMTLYHSGDMALECRGRQALPCQGQPGEANAGFASLCLLYASRTEL